MLFEFQDEVKFINWPQTHLMIHLMSAFTIHLFVLLRSIQHVSNKTEWISITWHQWIAWILCIWSHFHWRHFWSLCCVYVHSSDFKFNLFCMQKLIPILRDGLFPLDVLLFIGFFYFRLDSWSFFFAYFGL